MRGIPTTTWLATIVLVLLVHAGNACAAEVKSLRIWSGPDYTRAVFDVSDSVDYKLFELSKPNRIVLDLRSSALAGSFHVPAVQGLLRKVRAGRQGEHDARIVFDLADGVAPKSFLLPPSGKAGYRLVVDLYPPSGKSTSVKRLAEPSADKARKVTIAVDAGHGGIDPGATGPGGTSEKTITLAVARDLTKLIDRTPGMTAVMTRDGDYFVPLAERYSKARKAKADLFISIHADAFSSGDARGSSVWVLSPRGATTEAARWLADRENRADLVGGISLNDKTDTLAAVLLDLSQGATMGASNRVAQDVLGALRTIGPTHRNYVERANFVVLRSPDVPSILVETAFITNPNEEARLKDPRHRQTLAAAILDGVADYFRSSPPPGTLFAANNARKQLRGKSSRYIVTRGETLSAIAQNHGLTTAQLRAANDLVDERVRTGEVLQIPSG